MKIIFSQDKLWKDVPRTLQGRAGERLRKDILDLGARIIGFEVNGDLAALDVDMRDVRPENREQIFEMLKAESAVPEPLDVPAYLHKNDRGTAIELAARGVLKADRRLPLTPEEIQPYMEKLAFKALAEGPPDTSHGYESDLQGEVKLTRQEQAAIAAEFKAAGIALPPETDMRTADELEAERRAQEQKEHADLAYVEEQKRLEAERLAAMERQVFFS